MTSNKAPLISTALLIVAVTGAILMWLYLDQRAIHGVVLEVISGQPIADATLQLEGRQLTTNGAGQFKVNLEQARQVHLEASARGYFPSTLTFDLPWYLKTGHLEVRLAPIGLSIRVIDGWTEKPLPGVTLRVGNQSYQTDSDGQVTLTPQPLDFPLPISLAYAGYENRQIQLTRLPQRSSEMPLTLALEPHTLTGFVVAADSGEPLPDITVTASGVTQKTDSDGRFFLFRLLPGQIISVQPPPTFRPVQLEFDNQPTAVIEVPSKALAVNVIDAFSGLPLPGALVGLGEKVYKTNAQGQAMLEHIPDQGQLHIRQSAYFSKTVEFRSAQTATVNLIPMNIQGHIIDAETGQLLTQARMRLDTDPLPAPADGHYRLMHFAQTQVLDIRHAGYRSASLSLKLGSNTELMAENLSVQPCKEIPEPRPGPCLNLLLHPFVAKAIYVPFNLLSQPDQMQAIFEVIERTELNAIILDVKSDRGYLAWNSRVEQADWLEIDGQRPGWMTLESLLAEAEARDIYTIARMVIFKDNPLALGNPDLALTDQAGQAWIDGEGLAWANPYREEVWNYNIALAREVAALGFDEINLDYIRFPSDGNIAAISFGQESTPETKTKAIRTFVSQMREALMPYGTFLSADVFGLTVWVDPADDMNIGQRVIDIAPYVDYLAPMIYPSTFGPGSLGLANPADHPYEVIFRSQLAALERVPESTRVRPWLQGYWYGSYEMLLQKQAANDAGSSGWAWWNAGGVYDESIFERGSLAAR
jgi:hypothetical protein